MRIMLNLLAIFFVIGTCSAAETRGLTVVAKDQATGQQGEVKLYNKSYAVIIGIDKYPNLPPDRQLSYAVRDAQGIEQVLRKQFKFDKIVTLYNEQATQKGIVRLLTTELPREMGSEDSLFIFWAGHGNQEQTPDGDIGYLIPYDGSLDDISSAVTMSEIRDTISRKIPAKHVFYAMDACYSGLLTTRAVDPKVRRDLGYLREITKERVRQVLTAGSKGQEVLDGGPKGHSVFTGRLIEVLEATGDFITANEIQAILKEKVYKDAIGMGKSQTPSFGTLSGNGDFIFVPSKEYLLDERRAEQGRIQQDIEKSRKEQEKLQREMTELESLEQKAKQARNDRDLREAEAARQRAEAKLTLERLNQQKLEEEKRRKSLDEAELVKLEQERQKQLESARQLEVKLRQDDEQRASDLSRLEREQLITRQQEEQKVALLRTQAEERRKKSLVVAGSLSLDAAVAEIKSTSVRIDEISKEFATELAKQKAAADQRRQEKLALLKQSHDKQMVTLRQQIAAPQVIPNKMVVLKDEFETEAEYRDRVAKAEKADMERSAGAVAARNKVLETGQVAYDRLVNQVETTYQEDTRTQEQRINEARETAIKPLKERIAALSNKEFPLGTESLELSVGKYDAEKQEFPISIDSKPTSSVKVANNGTLSLPRDEAKKFKQQYLAGLVRPEAIVKTGSGEVVRVALANDADNYLMMYENGEFLTDIEKKRLVEERRRVERLIYTDLDTRLQWVRDGNLAGKQMNWDDAMVWAEKLDYAGYHDWRLPTKEELETLLKKGGGRPEVYINSNGFSNTQSSYYWSSTSRASNPSSAWDVDFGDGVVDYNKKVSYFYVRCVRGGQ